MILELSSGLEDKIGSLGEVLDELEKRLSVVMTTPDPRDTSLPDPHLDGSRLAVDLMRMGMMVDSLSSRAADMLNNLQV